MITLRIPTKDQYAFVEVQYIAESEDKQDEARKVKEIYDQFIQTFQETSNPEAFNDYLIALANSDLTKWGDANHYEGLSAKEKEVCQAFKRFVKRLPELE